MIKHHRTTDYKDKTLSLVGLFESPDVLNISFLSKQM
jgi:hypothetical protein